MAFVSTKELQEMSVKKFTVKTKAGSTIVNLSWTKPSETPVLYDLFIFVGNMPGTVGDTTIPFLIVPNGSATSAQFDLAEYGYGFDTFVLGIRPKFKTSVTQIISDPFGGTPKFVFGKVVFSKVSNIDINTETIINNPTGITSDTDGNLYTLNGFRTTNTSDNRVVSKISQDNTVTNLWDAFFIDNDNTPNSQLLYKDNSFYYIFSSLIKFDMSGTLTTRNVYNAYNVFYSQSPFAIASDGSPNYIYYTNESNIGTSGYSQLAKTINVHGLWQHDLNKPDFILTFIPASGWTGSVINTIVTGSGWLYDALLSNIGDTSDLQLGQIIINWTTYKINDVFNNVQIPAVIIAKTSNSITIRFRGIGSSLNPDNINNIFNDTPWSVSNDRLISGRFRFISSIPDIPPTSDFYNSNVVGGLGPLVYHEGFMYALRNGPYDFNSIVKINMNTGEATLVADGLRSAIVTNGGRYANGLTIANNAIYVAGGSRIIKVDFNGTKTVIAGGDAIGVPTDGTGSEVKFANARHITYNSKDGYLYVSDTGTFNGTQYGLIRTVSLDGVVGPKQATGETNVDSGNGDTSAPGGDFGIGNGGYVVDIPPHPGAGITENVTVTNPEEEVIAVIPISGGWGPDDVWTWRKDGDKLYLLLNGVIVWSYTLSPTEVFVFPSNGYRGFYQRGTRISIFPPIGGIIETPPLNGYRYVFNTEIDQSGLGWSPLFQRGVNKASQALLVFVDGEGNVSYTVEERPIDENVKRAAFVALGGRNYIIDENGTIAPSPILPDYVLQLIAATPYNVYLVEVP